MPVATYLKVVRRTTDRVAKARTGESTRGECPLSERGFGGSPTRKFLFIGASECVFMHFGCVLGQNFSRFSWDLWPELYMYTKN